MGKRSLGRKLEFNEASAKRQMLRTSPQKLSLVADLVRGLSVADALVQLTFSQKRISNDVKDTLLSAIANAENNHGLDIDRLYVNEIRVGRAMVMKRFRPRARGRVGKILKPFSHLEVIVRETEEE